MEVEQANPSNNFMLLLLRAMVVSDEGKGCYNSHVWYMKMNENEPSLKYR